VGRALGAAAWRYMRRLDRLFPLTIVASDFARADLEREGIDRIAHVPLGVDLAQFHPRRRQVAAETRRWLGIDDGPVIGFVGRFAREKEVHVLIEAWPEIERRTGASLVLIGDGPSQPSLAARVISKRVHWLPFERDRDALADLLAALDLYVAPCSIETFGLSALEALASGTPVLSADQGGVSELVAQSGAGSTFASGVSASLAEEAVSLLEDDLASMGIAARAYAENEHDWSTVFDRMFAVYRELLAR
jgi:alpha-1,6-mannosyltransferase